MKQMRNSFSLAGKNAVVICPENRYGTELVQGLLDAEAKVWLAGDVSRMPELPVAGRIPYHHGNAASAAALEQTVREQIGPLDILVENGMGTDSPGWDLSFDEICYQLKRTHLGTMLTVQALGRVMAEQGHGSVILVSDYGALVGYDPQNYRDCPQEKPADFSLVKGFIQGGNVNYARQASNYLAEHGCRCNTLALGPLEGTVDPAFAAQYIRHSQVKRLLAPSDIAHALAFLASDASAYITGITLPVDGGYTAK